MPTANDLLTAVASFMGRERSTFIKNGHDVLLQAANNARLYAERMIDFELSRKMVDVPNVSLSTGGDLDDAVLHDNPSTPVNVKKIIRPFVTFAGQTNTFPIAFYSRNSWLRRVQRNWERIRPIDPAIFFSPANKSIEWWTQEYFGIIQQFACMQSARKIYLVPADEKAVGAETITMYFDVYAWLPNYGETEFNGTATATTTNKLIDSAADFIDEGAHVGMVVRNTDNQTEAVVLAVEDTNTLLLNADIFATDENYRIMVANETDFLLESCFDWLLYRCVFELNFFVKEDERVGLSTQLMTDAWNAMRAWNENLISQSVDDSDLA